MKRLLAVAALVLLTVSFGARAASAGRAPTAPVDAAVTALDADCQHTFHLRPTTSGAYPDPCAFRSAPSGFFSTYIRVAWYWNCDGGCRIENVQGLLQICNANPSVTDAVSSDAVSLNVAVTKEMIAHSFVGGSLQTSCSVVRTAWLPVRGCGSIDRPLGYYPQVVSVLAQGRGTWFRSDSTRESIPTAPALLGSFGTYYLLGRGGRCS